MADSPVTRPGLDPVHAPLGIVHVALEAASVRTNQSNPRFDQLPWILPKQCPPRTLAQDESSEALILQPARGHEYW